MRLDGSYDHNAAIDLDFVAKLFEEPLFCETGGDADFFGKAYQVSVYVDAAGGELVRIPSSSSKYDTPPVQTAGGASFFDLDPSEYRHNPRRLRSNHIPQSTFCHSEGSRLFEHEAAQRQLGRSVARAPESQGVMEWDTLRAASMLQRLL